MPYVTYNKKKKEEIFNIKTTLMNEKNKKNFIFDSMKFIKLNDSEMNS